MTKQEFINKWGYEGTTMNNGIYNDLHEIIKQEAIAYAIWVDAHLWTRMSGKWWNDKPKGGKIILTDKQLYGKYFNNL